ncbi:MAG: hypothetical protein U1D30_24745 [Planctomycetota bacterium]
MSRAFLGACLLVMVAVVCATSGADEREPTTGKPPNTKLEKMTKRTPLPEFSPEREKTALDFVAKHHAKLTTLLEKLKEKQPKEYQKAIRDLFQTSQFLTELADKDPKQYGIELDAWKLKSQSELLAARLRRAPNAELEKELKEILARQVDNQITRNTAERDRLAARLKRVDAQLDLLKSERESTIQSRYDRLVQGKANKKTTENSKKTAAKPAEKSKTETATGP